MNLTIDIGNTSLRAAVFSKRNLLWSGKLNSEKSINTIANNFNIEKCLISNVSDEKRVPEGLSQFKPMFVSHRTHLPIKIKYNTPETLGSDRICAAVAGHSLHPKNTVLTIDAGTCIKYELVTSDGVYHGGNIAPGMNMRYRALADQTANLPLIKPDKLDSLMGQSTEEAIRNGVQLGIICEMRAMIQHLLQLYPDLKTLITGGDLHRFEKDLKTTIFAHPLLVLQGLNEIILFNEHDQA